MDSWNPISQRISQPRRSNILPVLSARDMIMWSNRGTLQQLHIGEASVLMYMQHNLT